MNYQPIDCSLHDRLEALATLRRACTIRYAGPGGRPIAIEDRIADVFARDGAEYLRTARGVEIRLDALLEVDGVGYGGAQC